MKYSQMREAKDLYLQTDMTKAEIAGKVGVTRRTILRWCKDDDWDRLRLSAQAMPALVAEKCYIVLGNVLSRWAADRFFIPTLQESQSMHYIAAIVKKLRNRCTVNESMELLSHFAVRLNKKNAELAQAIIPELEEFLEERASHTIWDYIPPGLESGANPDPNKCTREEEESIRDEADELELQQEIKRTGNMEEAIAIWEKGRTYMPWDPKPEPGISQNPDVPPQLQ